jgi:hypothetical protein
MLSVQPSTRLWTVRCILGDKIVHCVPTETIRLRPKSTAPLFSLLEPFPNSLSRGKTRVSSAGDFVAGEGVGARDQALSSSAERERVPKGGFLIDEPTRTNPTPRRSPWSLCSRPARLQPPAGRTPQPCAPRLVGFLRRRATWASAAASQCVSALDASRYVSAAGGAS